MMALSFFVRIEPAPCDVLFAGVVTIYLMYGGIKATVLAVPLIFYLLLYNLGGFMSFLEISNEFKAGMFVITSVYMAASAVFFCFFIATDTERRFTVFKNGYIIGAVAASVIGIAGYFNVGGTGAYLSPILRAQGTFKDPNVLSTYIILPALLMAQDVMLGTRTWRLTRLAGLAVILACLFLAFSRGAWLNFAGAAVLMVMLTYILSPSQELRSRIVWLAIAGAVLMAAMLAVLLSIDVVRSAFEDRATLTKDYDSGEFGRFGNQLNSIPILLESPFGFGPTKFRKIFTLDPHNVYLNAFSSYGWLGGISYFMLVASTIAVGFRALLIRSPFQGMAIAMFCAFFATALQGIQIDTDHWRHFYWILGLNWGLFAASAAYIRQTAMTRTRG
jgi:hypothetical protein